MIKKVGCDIECAPRIALGTHDDQVEFDGCPGTNNENSC